ncbi:hypothetical protein B0H13DRAFT_2381340 [Mycena leptocephala]|nr:hypothetical protein B0H13DRAFT_2381340 [Mycena leptocephala]
MSRIPYLAQRAADQARTSPSHRSTCVARVCVCKKTPPRRRASESPPTRGSVEIYLRRPHRLRRTPMCKSTILTPRRRTDQLRHERNSHHPTLAQVEPSVNLWKRVDGVTYIRAPMSTAAPHRVCIYPARLTSEAADDQSPGARAHMCIDLRMYELQLKRRWCGHDTRISPQHASHRIAPRWAIPVPIPIREFACGCPGRVCVHVHVGGEQGALRGGEE